MTKKSKLISSLFAVMALSSQAFADCELPASPIVPDGNVASQDELVAAQQAMKAFQGDLGEYRVCLDAMQAELAATEEAADATNEADTGEVSEAAAILNAKYDASIDAETAIAEEFNTAVRAFKARQPAAEKQ